MATFCKRRRTKESTPTSYNITITGSGNGTYCYVEIEGDKYIEAGEYAAPPGLVITAYVKGGNTTAYARPGYIYLDGETVGTSSTSLKAATYDYVLDSDVEIAFSYSSTGKRTITITRV